MPLRTSRSSEGVTFSGSTVTGAAMVYMPQTPPSACQYNRLKWCPPDSNMNYKIKLYYIMYQIWPAEYDLLHHGIQS